MHIYKKMVQGMRYTKNPFIFRLASASYWFFLQDYIVKAENET